MLKNPFFVYVGIFGGALLAYSLEWSGIYPELSQSVMLFFCITFAIAGLCALVILPYVKATRNHTSGLIPHWVSVALCLAFAADMLYTGGIPIYMLATGQNYKYTEFGIPTLHVAIITFGGAFAAVRFADYLYSKNRWFLLEAFLPIVYDLLIANRGAAMMAFLSWIFVAIIKRGGMSLRMSISTGIAVLGALFVFGILGNVRSGDVITLIGQPTEAFKDTEIPTPYFWAYIYLTSPIANFVKTTDELKSIEPEVPALIASELLPDFISKRVLPLVGADDRTEFDQVSPALNVSTIFTRSFVYGGWWGVTIICAMLFAGLILFVVPMSMTQWGVPALALLNTLVVFCVFDNMIAFTGMSLQVIWLVVLPMCSGLLKRTRWIDESVGNFASHLKRGFARKMGFQDSQNR